jgi:drug/metabolite transporter (DMT)-like permease
VSRAAVIGLYAGLVIIWSSTWVAIKIGLEDCPPLLGAGIRFAAAGLVLLAFAAARGRSLRTDARLAGILALMPFALAYGLVYWGEQHIPSGLAAVLFGILPLYTAVLSACFIPDAPLRARLVVGVLIALGGLSTAGRCSAAVCC